jgi:hypothetical protein
MLARVARPTMTQLPLYLAIYVAGVAVGLACGLGRRPLLACALAFPVGLAVMVIAALVMLMAHVPYGVPSGVAAVVLIAGVALAITSRRPAASRPNRAAWHRIAIASAGFAVVAAGLSWINLTLLSYDSHFMVVWGRAIFDDHALRDPVAVRLSLYGVFIPLAESGAGFTRDSYLYGLTPVLGLSGAAAFAATLWHAAGARGTPARGRARGVGLVTATAFTVYMVWLHSFYIHTNLACATYLVLALAFLWLAEVEGDATFLPIAFVAITAFSLARIENPIIATLLLAMVIPTSRLPARAVLAGLLAHAAVVSAWFLTLAASAPPSSDFLTPGKCYLTVAIVAAFVLDVAVLFRWRWRWLAALNRRLPVLIAAVVAASAVLAFVARPDHMWESADACYQNLIVSGFWFGVWPAIGALALLGLLVPAPPARAAFVWGLPVYAALILVLAYGRSPYRLGEGDSAARIAIHLVPACFFYFGIKFLPLLAGSRPAPGDSAPR